VRWTRMLATGFGRLVVAGGCAGVVAAGAGCCSRLQATDCRWLLAAVGFWLLCEEGGKEESEVSKGFGKCTMVGTFCTTDPPIGCCWLLAAV
jgi:hypothetical protein